MRPHISLDVRHVPASVEFYQKVFGVTPQKQTDDYAKFDLTAPALNLSLVSSTGRISSVDHLGIEVDSLEEIIQWKARLQTAGILERVEENKACCFARQDKLWFTDPDGNAWEIFLVHEQLAVDGPLSQTGCCVPAQPKRQLARRPEERYRRRAPFGDMTMTQDVQEVWMEVRGRLRAFIAKRVAADAAVEDLLQEVFLKIHDKIDQVQDPRRLVSWIFTVTRHAIIDYYRTPHRHREVPTGLTADVEKLMAAGEPEDESDEPRIQLASCLRPMVDQLAPEYRDALTLVELDGLTQQAAATKLGLSLSGMKSRVQRGRRQLKALLHTCCLIQLDARRGVSDVALRNPMTNPCAPPTPMMPERRPARKPT